MRIKVPYSLLPGINVDILMPMSPIIYRNSKYEFPTFALVDSGATGAIISTVIADALCINWQKIPKKTGLSTAGSFIFHQTEIEVEIYDHSFSLPVSIVEGISPFKCILGQADLFQKAKITFERYNNEFEIDFRSLN